ncbi:MAG: hypothetical protein HRT89_08090 [Lentisphaeria bacterium]|nr:hypothetical protein [Lentisphaeria bacterium]
MGEIETDVILKLPGKLARNDVLELTGVYSQSASRKTFNRKITVKRQAWPVNRTNLLLVLGKNEWDRFYYDNNAAHAFSSARLNPMGLARINNTGKIDLRGGQFTVPKTNQTISEICKAESAFSIELTITPGTVTVGDKKAPRHIITNRSGPGNKRINFSLFQAQSKLYLYIKTSVGPAQVALTDLTKSTANHIVVSYKPGELICYLNGKAVKKVDKLKGKLNWFSQSKDLIIGGQKNKKTWWGQLNHIAIFSRVMTAKEAVANYRAVKKTIRRIPRIIVKAKLTAKSKIPSPGDISPYVDSLIVNEYNVVEIIKGQMDGKKIHVLQWGLIAKKHGPISKIPVGTILVLELEAKDKHPELNSEVIRNSIKEDDDADIFLDVSYHVDGLIKTEK